MSEMILNLEDIEFTYPKSKHNPSPFTLKLDNFRVTKGQKKAIIAPNGSGKTTLVNIILGITKLKKGRVELAEELKGNAGKKNIAFFSPRIHLSVARLSVEENLKYAAAFWGTDEKSIEAILAIMKLTEHRKKWFDRLSTGLMNRVIWAMELLKGPSLIILDEAFRSVDQETEDALLEVLEKLNHDNGSAILFFEPKYHSHLRIADDFYSLSKGKISEFNVPVR